MKVVRFEDEQLREAIKLSEYAFQYKVAEDQIEERVELMKKYHEVYGVIDEGEIAAKLHLLPFEIFVGQKKWKMGGIAGIATYPEYRRQGYVREMLQFSLEKMREDGYSISMLHPFSVSFYRKYGWELLTNRLKSTLNKTDLQQHEAVPGAIKRFDEKLHAADLSTVYEQYAKRFTGMLVREHVWWQRNVYKGMFGALYYDTADKPTGYILYQVKDSKMEIEEFVALDREARSGLWNFICQHDSMVKEIEMITNEKEPLFFTLQEPQSVKTEVTPYFMVRIVEVLKFLQDYPFTWSTTANPLHLQVVDSYATWNNHFFEASQEGVSIGSENQHALTLSINSLSTILFGYKRPTDLYQVGLIQGPEEELQKLEQLIPQQQSFFNDFF